MGAIGHEIYACIDCVHTTNCMAVFISLPCASAGKQVVLTAGADGVTIQEAAGEDAGAAASNGSAPGNAAQAAAPKAASSKAEKVVMPFHDYLLCSRRQ